GEISVSAENDPIKNINANSSYTKSFSENTELKINVKPSIGYVFKGWNNESLVSGNKEDGFSLIVREKNTNLIAFFVKKEYNISIKTEEGGTIDVVTDVRSESSTNTFVEKLPYDSKISICVKPNIGYMFTGWNDATYISGNEKTGYTISVTDNIDITAKFSRKDHNVLIHPNYGGTVTVSYLGQTSTNSTNFDKNIIEGTTLELTPCPDEGYTFAGWEGDTTKLSENKNGVYTVAVDGAINLVAKFTIAKCNVSILTTEHGKIAVNKTPNPTNSFTSTVDYGTSLSINVYPDSECFFKGWEGSSEKLVIGNKEDGFSVPVKDDINLTAVFEPIIKHKVTILNSNGGGTINVLTANDTNWYTVNKDDSLTMNLAEGSEFKIRVFPNDGYSFIRWDQKANIIKEEENSFIVKVEGQDIILSPSFQRMNVSYAEKECQVTVTSANMSGGRIGVSDNGGTSIGITEKLTVKKGAKIDIEAIPYEGYEFVCWNGISSNNQSVRKDINISYDREFVAYFKPISNYKHIEWDTSNKHELDAKYFTTVCDRVKEDANFYVDNNVICYYTAKNKETKYTDPATGRDYDVIGVCDASTWLDMGDVDAPFSGNNALNFTTCSELIDEIFTKEQNNIEKGYYTKADSAPRLGFVWAKNERGKWQPYVVKEILDNAFANAIFNPIHCNVIVPWTVEYVGNRAFEGASINNNIKRKKNKIYPIYTKRLARGAIVTWEYCKENNMTYIYDDDWAKPIYVTYDEYDNTWKVIDGDSRIPLSGGDGTDKLMPRGTKPSATIDNDDTTIKK
ncbi:MAG: InlB B-repeat-containing protein, partial [Malacoplasma sp.]|nr:InlB B-repeat-containing protein [Malacoplasma sp.]